MNKEQTTINVLMRELAYEFLDETLLLTALTHRSLVDKKAATTHGINNERLEFLGDAVLSMVAAAYLYRQKNYFNEGDLSRLRAQYVCEENLAEAARKIDLGRFIRGDKSMRASGSTNSKAILADALEALIGAVFIDGGLAAAEAVIFRVLGAPPTKVYVIEKDVKTHLQEIIQAEMHTTPKYVVLETSGPGHAPSYLVGIEVNGEIIARAFGENKKTAAHNAAHAALIKFTRASL